MDTNGEVVLRDWADTERHAERKQKNFPRTILLKFEPTDDFEKEWKKQNHCATRLVKRNE